MNMDELVALQEKVDTRIQELAQEEMQALESKMAKLRNLTKSKRGGRGGVRGKAPVKYRDPKTGKGWSGRGMTPVWLREYEEAGKKRESFAV